MDSTFKKSISLIEFYKLAEKYLFMLHYINICLKYILVHSIFTTMYFLNAQVLQFGNKELISDIVVNCKIKSNIILLYISYRIIIFEKTTYEINK